MHNIINFYHYSIMIEIIPFYFLLSFFISFSILYILTPLNNIIIKEPIVDDTVSKLYIDDNNVCYRYKRQEVACNK